MAVTGSAGGGLTLGGNETIGSLAGAANVAIGSNTLTVGGNNQGTTYSGGLSGAGVVTKVGSGTLTLTGNNTYSGGTIVESGVLFGTSMTLQGDIANNGTVSFVQETNDVYAGVIGGGGGLEKSGAGNLTVTGTSTYTGATNVAAGRLSVDGQLGNTMVTVLSDAELGGSGVIMGDVAIVTGGTLSPGTSIASLAAGSTTFSAGSTFAYEYDSSAPPSVGADLLVVSGSLSIESGALIALADLAGSAQPFENGTAFALINYTGPGTAACSPSTGTPWPTANVFSSAVRGGKSTTTARARWASSTTRATICRPAASSPSMPFPSPPPTPWPSPGWPAAGSRCGGGGSGPDPLEPA